eukprot:m.722024 g.722024  ORF g.722024 m.722024 type:complete len:351 (-) comp23016_c0_seq1:1332-2384(-)
MTDAWSSENSWRGSIPTRLPRLWLRAEQSRAGDMFDATNTCKGVALRSEFEQLTIGAEEIDGRERDFAVSAVDREPRLDIRMVHNWADKRRHLGCFDAGAIGLQMALRNVERHVVHGSVRCGMLPRCQHFLQIRRTTTGVRRRCVWKPEECQTVAVAEVEEKMLTATRERDCLVQAHAQNATVEPTRTLHVRARDRQMVDTLDFKGIARDAPKARLCDLQSFRTIATGAWFHDGCRNRHMHQSAMIQPTKQFFHGFGQVLFLPVVVMVGAFDDNVLLVCGSTCSKQAAQMRRRHGIIAAVLQHECRHPDILDVLQSVGGTLFETPLGQPRWQRAEACQSRRHVVCHAWVS